METIIRELQDMRHLEWSKIRHSSGTAGSFLKAYSDLGGKRIYYKLSDFDSVRGIVGHECVNEVIADRLLDLLQIDHVHYSLIHALIRIREQEYETWLCASDSFRKPEERKITLEDYYQAERQDAESPLQFCVRMGWETYIHEMLIVDYLILNRDRHGANIELLMDRKKKRIRPAPLFDHGLSFVCRCHTEADLKGIDVMEDKKIQSFVGADSARENLKLVSRRSLKKLPSLKKNAFSGLFEGLEDALSRKHFGVIRRMLEKRWETVENLRHS
ncbi:MAG: hypothetical protein IJQ21_02080 [Lachnospiraceae bacterium]|nr:hypothetical protein [Lachnospiraceae bacterium]